MQAVLVTEQLLPPEEAMARFVMLSAATLSIREGSLTLTLKRRDGRVEGFIEAAGLEIPFSSPGQFGK